MIEAKLDGRKRRGAMTRKIARDKVLLALYWLSDDVLPFWIEGDVAPIAGAAGLSIPSTRRALAEMERGGVIVRHMSPLEERRIRPRGFGAIIGRPAALIILVDEARADVLASFLDEVDEKWAARHPESVERIRRAVEMEV